MRVFIAAFVVLVSVSFGFSQKQRTPHKKLPGTIPVKAGTELREAALKLDAGTVTGRSYINPTLSFQVTFPDSWLIPGPDFEAYMKSAGFD